MDASDWIAIASAVIAIPSAVVAVQSLLRSRTAKEEAEKADQNAKEAVAVNERMAAAQERIAVASERRIEELLAGRSISSEPKIAWEIEWRGGSSYVLRNLGTDIATGVLLEPDDANMIVSRNVRNGEISIGPLQSYQFGLAPSLASPLPAEIMVRCNEMPVPVAVRIPPKLF